MKNFLIVISVIFFIASISCKEKFNAPREKEAVLKVLQEEGDAFAKNDLNRLYSIYIQDSTQTRLGIGHTYQRIFEGWNDVQKLYENYAKMNSSDSSWKNPRNLKENLKIKVSENSAWVLCDNIWEFQIDSTDRKQINNEITFLEKINEEWKISFKAFIQKPTP